MQGVGTTGDDIKRNLKYPLKRIMCYNIKVSVTTKSAKLPRTYDRSKCVSCLEDLLIPGTVTLMFDQRRRSFVEESYDKRSPFSREKIEIGLFLLYHKTCYKLKRRLYKVNENM